MFKGSRSHSDDDIAGGNRVQHTGTGEVYRGNIDRLIARIAQNKGIDLGQYRRSYVERRVAARLRVLNLHTYRQYIDYLDQHTEEYEKLLDTLTINVTDFFRDPEVYRVFNDRIVPAMIEEKLRSRHRMIRVWSAGCATGEEPYSIAMSFLDAFGEDADRFMFTVLGTDLDVNALERARQAEYPIDKLKYIPKPLQVRYVQAGSDTFRIVPEVTARVRFRQLNLFTDRPVNMVDVIFCRNVFIYFNRDEQERVLERFWSSLARGGYLVLGRSEKMASSMIGRFELVSGRDRIYRKPIGS